jgi:hypothetical protein
MTVYTEHLKLRKPDIGQTSWGDEIQDNIEIEDFYLGGAKAGNVVLSGCAPSDGGGLDVDYAGGEVSVNGTRHTITGGSKTCTAESKNWLCVDASGVVQLYTTAPTAAYAAIAMIDAGTTSIDRIADCRKLAEGAAAFDLTYTPENYAPDTSESKEIEQHLAGIDAQLGLLLAGDLIINGSMQIAQLGSSFTGLSNGDTQYTLDQWEFYEGGNMTGVIDIKRTADHPTTPNGYCLEIDVTTAQASAATNDIFRIQHKIEGQFLQHLQWGTSNARNLTLSFWVKGAQTGNHALCFYHVDGGYSYVASYSIDAANTWEFKTIAIPALTDQAFDNDNERSIQLMFTLLSDTAHEGTVNTWELGFNLSFSGAVNVLSSTSNNLRITDIRLQPGSVYTPSPPRLYPIEKYLCHRYLVSIGTSQGIGWGLTGTTNQVSVRLVLPAPLRADPSISLPSGNLDVRYGGTSYPITGSHITACNLRSPQGITIGSDVTGAGSNTSGYGIINNSPIYISAWL